MSDAIYLDYAATTPTDPAVAEEMSRFLGIGGAFGNPASRHAFGQEAEKAVEGARLSEGYDDESAGVWQHSRRA